MPRATLTEASTVSQPAPEAPGHMGPGRERPSNPHSGRLTPHLVLAPQASLCSWGKPRPSGLQPGTWSGVQLSAPPHPPQGSAGSREWWVGAEPPCSSVAPPVLVTCWWHQACRWAGQFRGLDTDWPELQSPSLSSHSADYFFLLSNLNYILLILLSQLSPFFPLCPPPPRHPCSRRPSPHHCPCPRVTHVSSSAVPLPVLHFPPRD